jgi:hypothetical protein
MKQTSTDVDVRKSLAILAWQDGEVAQSPSTCLMLLNSTAKEQKHGF